VACLFEYEPLYEEFGQEEYENSVEQFAMTAPGHIFLHPIDLCWHEIMQDFGDG